MRERGSTRMRSTSPSRHGTVVEAANCLVEMIGIWVIVVFGNWSIEVEIEALRLPGISTRLEFDLINILNAASKQENVVGAVQGIAKYVTEFLNLIGAAVVERGYAAILVLVVTGLLCIGIKESTFAQGIITSANEHFDPVQDVGDQSDSDASAASKDELDDEDRKLER